MDHSQWEKNTHQPSSYIVGEQEQKSYTTVFNTILIKHVSILLPSLLQCSEVHHCKYKGTTQIVATQKEGSEHNFFCGRWEVDFEIKVLKIYMRKGSA